MTTNGHTPGAKQIGPDQVQWARDGVTLTLAAPSRKLNRISPWSTCPSGYACLWRNFDAGGRRVQFYRYGTYNLAAYGMPRFQPAGASSYYNHQTGGAKAILHADFDFDFTGHGNLYGALNDRSKSITLRP